jgi:hypothetical protein
MAGRAPGWTVDAGTGGVQGGREEGDEDTWRTLGHSKELTTVYNGAPLREFYRRLFGHEVVTQPTYTWMRMRGKKDMTIVHAVRPLPGSFAHSFVSLCVRAAVSCLRQARAVAPAL